MLDVQLMRNDLDTVIARLKSRSADGHFDVARFKELETRRKEIQISAQMLQAERNAISKKIGHAKAKKEQAEADALMQKASLRLDELKKQEIELSAISSKLDFLLLKFIHPQ